MNLADTLSYISGLLLIGGYIPYAVEVMRKETVPARASWLIWSLSTIILLFGVMGTGTTEAIWVPIADAVGCTFIFLLSIKLGTGGWKRTDKISFAIVVLSLCLWYLTQSAMIALVMNLAVYVSGYIPTIAKAIKEPQSESTVAWSLFLMGVVVNLLVVAVGTDTGFAVWLYPSVLVLAVSTLYGVMVWPRRLTTSAHKI